MKVLPIGTKVRMLGDSYEFDKDEICTVVTFNRGMGGVESCPNYLKGKRHEHFACYGYKYVVYRPKNVIGGTIL